MAYLFLPAASPELVSANARRTRLRRLIAAARTANPADLPAMASPPAVTSIGDTITSGLTQSYGVTTHPALFTLYGGLPYVYGGTFWRAPAVSRTSGGNVVATKDATGARVAFRTDAPSLDVAVVSQGATAGRLRLLIDGQYADKAGATNSVNPGTYGTTRFNVAFGSRRWRRIDVEFQQDGGFRGVQVGPGDMVQPVAAADRYRIALIGDSISVGEGATRKSDGWAYLAGKRLGGVDLDLVSMSIGGTGYVAAGTGGALRFGDRLDDLLAYGTGGVDEVWFAGGANDQGQAAATITANALACLRGARTRLPSAPIIMFGGFVGGQGWTVARDVETAVKAAFDQFADPNSGFVPFNLATPPLQNANNYATYMAGATDTTHPPDIGHDYIGSYAAEARRAIAL